MKEGKTKEIEHYLNWTLSNSISVFDTKAQETEKENSYHTLLVGLLTGNSDWVVRSNVEAGEGFADILVEPEDPDAGIVIELKYSKEAAGLEKACELPTPAPVLLQEFSALIILQPVQGSVFENLWLHRQ